MSTFKTRDGQTVKPGSKGTFTLRHGEYNAEHERYGHGIAGQPVLNEVTGQANLREQVERVYDNEGIAIGKISEFHWEVLTGDPVYPAVGFLPENVLTFIEN